MQMKLLLFSPLKLYTKCFLSFLFFTLRASYGLPSGCNRLFAFLSLIFSLQEILFSLLLWLRSHTLIDH